MASGYRSGGGWSVSLPVHHVPIIQVHIRSDVTMNVGSLPGIILRVNMAMVFQNILHNKSAMLIRP